MQYVPVSSSIIAANYLSAFLIEKYQFEPNTTCKLIKAGINHSYLVQTPTDQFIFRVYSLDWRSPLEIQEEIRLLDLLYSNKIPVSFALPDANGNYLQQLGAPEGVRYGVLFSFAKGEKLLNMPADVHFNIGATMARLHKITHNLTLQRVEYTPEVVLKNSFEKLKNYLPADTEEMQFMAKAQLRLLDILQSVNAAEVRQGVLHLDIWFDNMVICDGDVTLFDFDFCGNGMLCYDIAYSVLQIHSTEKDKHECKLKVSSFLEGYGSVTKISEEEKRLLPALGVCLYFFYLGIQCERYENWSNTFVNETYLKRYITVLVKTYYELNNLDD
jgi:Ser/Thr protein kinase RdoA (MazF antagonist)